MNDHRHPEITELEKEHTEFKERYKSTLARIQSACKHEKILHLNGHDNTFFNYTLPRRICLQCGYEEEAWHWPGHRTSYFFGGESNRHADSCCEPTLLNNEFVKTTDDSQYFYQQRL